MKQDILFEYSRKAGFPTGAVLAYYDLSGIVDTDNETDRNSQYKLISGHTKGVYDTYVVYNQLHTTGSQVINTGDTTPEYVIAADNYPAQVLSNSTAVTGSGNFDGQSLLAVTKPITGENWTCFLDFSGEFAAENPTLSQVVVSTMTGYDSLSGFHVGINGSNRLYYEYITSNEGSNYERTVETIPNHLKTFNLLSIAKTPDTLELSLHRPDQESFSLKTPLENYTNSETLMFGGFNNHDSVHMYDPNLYYTGFSGFINSVVLFNDYMTESSRDTFAESYYLDSYTAPSLTTETRVTKQVTGVEVQSQAIGFGVTGYKKVISGYLKDQNGNLIPNYVDGELTGPIYRNVLVDLTGQDNISSTTGFFADEVVSRNTNYVSKATSMEGSITFSVPVEASENLEIYTHGSVLNTINHNSEQTYSFGSFDLADDSKFRVQGYQIKNDNFSYDSTNKQPFIQLYRNGFMQYEVSGLFSVNDISGLPILDVNSDSTIQMGSITAPSLFTTVLTTATGGTENIYSLPTSAYTGGFFEYTLIGNGGARSGNIISIWSGTTTQFNEITTNDVGTSTSGLSFNVFVSGGSAILSASAVTGTYTIKTIIRGI